MDLEIRDRQPVGDLDTARNQHGRTGRGLREPAGQMGVVDPDPRSGVGVVVEMGGKSRRVQGEDRAVLDEKDAVGAGQPRLHPVLHDHHRAAVGRPHRLDRRQDLGGRRGVQVRRGLVEQQQVRIGHGARRDGEQLLLATAEPGGVTVQGHGQPGPLEGAHDPRPDPLRRDGRILQGERDVITDPLHHDIALGLLLDQPDPG